LSNQVNNSGGYV